MPVSQAIDALADRVLSQLGAQRDLPRVKADPASWLDGLSLNLPNVSLALLILAVLGGLAYTLVRLRRGQAGWDVPTQSPASGAEGAAAHRQAAEAHAAAGRLVEAMHELLLQALADIRRHSGGRLDACLTSREIHREAPLREEARAALGSIIARVEWTYFGLRPATPVAWQECRAAFDILARALESAA